MKRIARGPSLIAIAAAFCLGAASAGPARAGDALVWDIGSEHVVDEASARFLCFLKPDPEQRSTDDDTVIGFTEKLHSFMVSWRTDGFEAAQATDAFADIKAILDEQNRHLHDGGVGRTTNCFRMTVLPGSIITPLAVVHRAEAPEVTVHALYAAIGGPPSPAGEQTVYGYVLTDWQERVREDPAR